MKKTVNFNAAIRLILGKLQGAVADPVFTTPVDIMLFQNDIVPDPNGDATQFTECDFTGYAAKVLALANTAPMSINPEGDYYVAFPHFFWASTGTTVSNSIYGFWVSGEVMGEADTVIWAHRFETPFQMVGPPDLLIVEPRLILGQPAGN